MLASFYLSKIIRIVPKVFSVALAPVKTDSYMVGWEVESAGISILQYMELEDKCKLSGEIMPSEV